MLFIYVRGTKKKSCPRESVMTVTTVVLLAGVGSSIYIRTLPLGVRHPTREGDGVLGFEPESKLYHFALRP